MFTTDGQVEVDKKLEQYLSIHSMNLSKSVCDYIERSKTGKLGEGEQIKQLGLIAFERKKFLKSLSAVEVKFQRRLKEVNILAKAKARQGMDLIIK